MAENLKMQMKNVIQTHPQTELLLILPSSIHWQKVKNTFSKKCVFIFERGWGRKGQEERERSLKQTSHCVEPDMALDLMTLSHNLGQNQGSDA